MANYANLEAAIQAAIYENNTNDITGAALQTVLLQMVSDMGKSGMLCNGVCDGNTVPPVAPDSNIFYIAPTGTYANFGGLTVADGEWAIFIYNGGWQKQSIPVVTADAVPTTGSTNPVQSGGVADALDTKADIDGYYSTLTAGSAENLIGRGTVPAEYTRRTSGGSADIGSGAAAIEKIHGNTIVWNQLVQNGNFAAATGWSASRGTLSISGGVATFTGNSESSSSKGFYVNTNAVTGVIGHKYYVAVSIKGDVATTCRCSNGIGSGSLYSSMNMVIGTSYLRYETIWTNSDVSSTLNFGIRWNDTANNSGNSIYVQNYMAVDLTLMFGSGNEPSSVAEFTQYFPLSFYASDFGSLLSLTGTGIETNGFNQWDEEWESGEINSTTGADAPAASKIRSKNYIPVFPSTAYYIKVPAAYGASRLAVYDIDKNYIGTLNVGWFAIDGGKLFTTPANGYYVRFFVTSTTYNNDICINLSWSGYRNGEYEAYWDSTLALPITTVTSGGSAVFADGMKGVGSVYDELTSTKAVKRMGIVDLGSLSWTSYTSDTTGHSFVCNTKSDAKLVANNNTVANILTIYETIKFDDISVWVTKDKAVCQVTGGSPNRWIIRDTAYSNAATFTTAMSGKYLVYELATPVEYTLDSEVNLNYRVDDFGTETLLPQNNATPTTAPIIYDVRYAMNAVDTLRNLPKNYISKDSMEHILNAMVTAGVISAYTLTWNATNENYDCTITA